MGWFKKFYETDYFKYYYEPKLEQIPAQEVDFIARHGRLDFAGDRPRVFDICCGVGRHGRGLARLGCKVIGVDLSASNIEAARQQAQREGLSYRCSFHQADIREFNPPADCDLAINIFTSFGYFDSDEENAVIMAKASQSLRPGGRFILDVVNREMVISSFKPYDKRGSLRNYVIDESRLDLPAGRVISTWTFVRGKSRSQHTISIRLYALHELIAMARNIGLRFVEAWGSFAEEPYGPKTPRCIFIAEKV
jgi:SAM-dependent methyltransferase